MHATTLPIVLLVFASAYVAHAESSTPLASDTEQIQLSSAGILGVASLGLLGIKISKSNPVRRETACLMAAYMLLAIVLAAHLLAIAWAQQGALLQLHYDTIMYATVGLVVGILVCFMLLLWFQTTMPNVDDVTDLVRSVAEEPTKYMKGDVDNPRGFINNWGGQYR